MKCVAGLILVHAVAVTTALAGELVFETPSDDRWHYPFNFTPGSRPTASVFGAAGNLDFPNFNDRDGVFLIAWDTSELIEPGQGVGAYNIASLVITLTHLDGTSWPIDLTVDEWFTFDINLDGFINGDGIPRGEPGDMDGESDDLDPGRPIELFGVGFGPFTAYETWTETTPYVGSECDIFGNNCFSEPRDPYPFVFQDETFAMLHVEDNVSGFWNDDLETPEVSFTPTPWAVGDPIGYLPGQQTELFDVVFDVDLDLSDGAVHDYFAEQLNAGRLIVAVTSLRETEEMGGDPGSFPVFLTKEGVMFEPTGHAPTLSILLEDAEPVPGDFDGDGIVDLMDAAVFVDCLGGPDVEPMPTPPTTPADCLLVFDFDGDADVDLADAGTFVTVIDG